MSPEVFLDAGYALALASTTDQFHQAAVDVADALTTGRVRLITTQAVLLEIGNGLAKPRYRAAAAQLLSALHS